MRWFKRRKPAVIEMEMVHVKPLTGIEKMEVEYQANAERQRREARDRRDAELRQEIAKLRGMVAPHLQMIARLEAQLSTPPYLYQQMMNASVQGQYTGVGSMGGLLGNLFGEVGGRAA